MTDDEILELAADFLHGGKKGTLIKFARVIAAKERDACAALCESICPSQQEYDQRFYTACTLCANAIRARGE